MEIAAHNGVHGNGYDVLYSIKSQMIHYCPGNGGGGLDVQPHLTQS